MWRFPPITFCCLRCMPTCAAGGSNAALCRCSGCWRHWAWALRPTFADGGHLCVAAGGGKRPAHPQTAGPCGLFLGTCAAGYAAGVVLGSLNNGYSASRENYGVFSFNLNALFNPQLKGGYTWSRILPARPQLYGQYDGFNYLGFGMLAFAGRAVRGGSGVGCAQQGRPRRAGGAAAPQSCNLFWAWRL